MTGKRLEGKVALITGASQGIGKETAVVFAREGAKVIVSDINDLLGEQVAKELGPDSTYMRLDVSNEGEWREVIANIMDRFGKLDILVNNAGITGFYEGCGPQDPEHVSLENWRKVQAINSEGTFLGCKYAIPAMKLSPAASIINMSSRSGLVGIPNAAAYAASKASIRNHTKTVALYCAQKGYPIRCNSVHPAAIMTPMWEEMLGPGPSREKAVQEIVKDIPLKRMGTPEDVAYSVLFLASDESRYISGIELTLDGGILAGSNVSPKKYDEELSD